MLNEDDLRPGDLIVDAMGGFWHVHDDGKIWCSEPENRISFEHARSAGPFKYASGRDPKRDTVQVSEDDSVKHEGKWTRGDLPPLSDIAPIAASTESYVYFAASVVLDAVVDHLNARHPKPQPYDQGGVRGADSLLYRAERAERERDAAVARAEQAENARDAAAARAEQMEKKLAKVMSDYQDVEDERDELKARAEGAVHVVLERDIAAVEVEPDDSGSGWMAGSTWWSGESTASGMREKVALYVRLAAECEALARHIEVEAVVDPVEAKARVEADRRYSGDSNHAFIEGAIWAAHHAIGQEASRDE